MSDVFKLQLIKLDKTDAWLVTHEQDIELLDCIQHDEPLSFITNYS